MAGEAIAWRAMRRRRSPLFTEANDHLDGLVRSVVDQNSAGWNRLAYWIRVIEGLRLFNEST